MRHARGVGSALAVLGIVAAGLVLTPGGSPEAAADVAPINPVRVDLNGHPANSGFLVFVEGDVALNADEAEGTLALGGNLTFNSDYNVMGPSAEGVSDIHRTGRHRANVPVCRWRNHLAGNRSSAEGARRWLHQDR